MIAGLMMVGLIVYLLGLAFGFAFGIAISSVETPAELVFGRAMIWPLYVPKFVFRSLKAVCEENFNG